MKYISTRGKSPALDFNEILLAGLAPDGGLYVPEEIPKFSEAEIIYPQSMWASRSSLMTAYSYYYGNYYLDAIDAENSGNFEQALEFAEKAVEIDPEHSDAWWMISTLLIPKVF